MKLSPEYRALMNELLAQEIEACDGPDGVDKAQWHQRTSDRLAHEFPQFSAAIAYEARAILLWSLMNQMAQRSLHPFLLRDREHRSIEQRARMQRERVQIPAGNGAFRLKRFMDCTKAEVALLLDYFERQKRSIDARIRWYRDVYEQMDLLGLSDDARVSDVVADDADESAA